MGGALRIQSLLQRGRKAWKFLRPCVYCRGGDHDNRVAGMQLCEGGVSVKLLSQILLRHYEERPSAPECRLAGHGTYKIWQDDVGCGEGAPGASFEKITLLKLSALTTRLGETCSMQRMWLAEDTVQR